MTLNFVNLNSDSNDSFLAKYTITDDISRFDGAPFEHATLVYGDIYIWNVNGDPEPDANGHYGSYDRLNAQGKPWGPEFPQCVFNAN